MVLVMDLVVIIFVAVKANDMVSTSFQPSSPQTSLPHPSELDHVPLSTCLKEKIESWKECKKKTLKPIKIVQRRVFNIALAKCMHPLDPMRWKARKAALQCLRNYGSKKFDFEGCLYIWYIKAACPKGQRRFYRKSMSSNFWCVNIILAKNHF